MPVTTLTGASGEIRDVHLLQRKNDNDPSKPLEHPHLDVYVKISPRYNIETQDRWEPHAMELLIDTPLDRVDVTVTKLIIEICWPNEQSPITGRWNTTRNKILEISKENGLPAPFTVSKGKPKRVTYRESENDLAWNANSRSQTQVMSFEVKGLVYTLAPSQDTPSAGDTTPITSVAY